MADIVIAIGVFAATFLLGSVPWGLIISKAFFHTDIREHGSGNIGTTNAMRTMGKKGGAAVFLLDFGKGIASGFIGLAAASMLSCGLFSGEGLMGVATMGCTLGHIFSPWLGFKGGKGIAVAIGALFVCWGPAAACIELFAIFAVLVLLTRYVSVGSIASAALCPVIAAFLFWGDWLAIFCYFVTGATVVWAHRGNIERLRAGNERRVGAKKKQ